MPVMSLRTKSQWPVPTWRMPDLAAWGGAQLAGAAACSVRLSQCLGKLQGSGNVSRPSNASEGGRSTAGPLKLVA